MRTTSSTTSRLYRPIVFAILGLLSLGCEDEERRVLPETHVNLVIQLQLPGFSTKLEPLGGIYIYPREGYQGRGIYVVHNHDISQGFSAYDVTCPRHFPERPLSTALDGTDAYCKFCNTRYNLYNHAVSENGNWHLQSYRCLLQGNNLHIRNR